MKLNPETTTIIDDGQFLFPVSTDKLQAFVAAQGKVSAENYEKFCDTVPHLLPGVLPGSAEMIDECAALVESGAREYRVA